MMIEFGNYHGPSLIVEERPRDPEIVCIIETETFSDLHGAVPGSYSVGPAEHRKLVRELAHLLDDDALEALIADLEASLAERRSTDD